MFLPFCTEHASTIKRNVCKRNITMAHSTLKSDVSQGG